MRFKSTDLLSPRNLASNSYGICRFARITFAAALLSLAPFAHGATIAISPQSVTSVDNFVAGFTQGWAFSLTVPIEITALGVADVGADGLSQAHEVSLWNATGTRLA